MHRRIIIGRNDQGYYYTVSSKENGKWAVIEYHNDDVGDKIKELLDVKIVNLRLISNLLLVKTNDDLVVIDNYKQINHDMVFKSFNRNVSKMTINKTLLSKKLSLQRKTKYEIAHLGAKLLCSATLTGILILPAAAFSPLNSGAVVYAPTVQAPVQVAQEVAYAPNEQEKLQQEMLEIKERAREAERQAREIALKAEQERLAEEEYLQSKVKEYSAMYFIDYSRALQVVESRKDEIKTNYQNEEFGILSIISEMYYNDSSINKAPQRSNISSMEREKLLLKFAKVYGITDANSVTTMLAIYRLETGNGSSPACVNKNNFGGLKSKTSRGDYDVMSFKSPEIGAAAMVDTFLSIKNRTINSSHYNPSRSLEDNLNVIYCGETSWPVKVREIKRDIVNDYNINQYVEEAKAKQLTKK